MIEENIEASNETVKTFFSFGVWSMQKIISTILSGWYSRVGKFASDNFKEFNN